MEGWTGKDCEEDVNECEAEPNLCNNGICQNTVGGYECYCRPGFVGRNCEQNFIKLMDPKVLMLGYGSTGVSLTNLSLFSL